jgi:hypothetical protein
MTLTITFILTLDAQYTNVSDRQWGMLGKKVNFLEAVNGHQMSVCTCIESLDASDYRGDAVAGKKGERFVYFGLEQSGKWLRRWKLRQYQLDDIFESASANEVTVNVLLGKEVTPQVSLAS